MNLNLPGADVELVPDFIALHDADRLLERLTATLPWKQRDVIVRGQRYAQPRLTSWHGDAGRYTYSGLTLEADPWTAELDEIRGMMEERTGTRFNSVLANLYRAGRRDGIGMHSDEERELEPDGPIFSISLGEERPFVLAPKRGRAGRRVEVRLPHGSLLMMRGPTQRNYLHGVDKPAAPSRAARLNLTFRNIRAT